MFRVKIILLSILISGSVLVGFGLYFLSVINKAGMDRIDQEILALGGSQLHAPPRPAVWQNFGQSLHFIYDEKRLKNLILQVTGPQKGVFFKSADWPREISEASFPEFDHEMAGPPGRDIRGREAPPGSRIFGPDDALRPRRRDLPDNNSLAGIPPRFNDRESLPLPDDHDRYSQFLPPPADNPFWPPVRKKEACFRTIKTPTGSWRVAIIGNPWVTVMIGMNMAGYYRDKERFQTALLITVPVALLLLAGGGWIIAHRAMRPVALITRTAERINARALDQRIPRTETDRELSRLVDVINDMLDRLQKSFNQAVRFSADAAHELQDPTHGPSGRAG